MKNLNTTKTYKTLGGLNVTVHQQNLPYDNAIDPIVDKLDSHLGCVFTSGYEYPHRYTRWDIGFINPPLKLTSKKLAFEISALNPRGSILIKALQKPLQSFTTLHHLQIKDGKITGEVTPETRQLTEEERSRQHSIFTLIRALIDFFKSNDENNLGFYGAFGYDLAYQFEKIAERLARDPNQDDLVLYLPDSLIIVDHQAKTAIQKNYEFSHDGESTENMARTGDVASYIPAESVPKQCDHEPGEYAEFVTKAKEYFKRGDLFEVVLSRTFFEPCQDAPTTIFKRLKASNPAPYAFIINLGKQEYLVGASPEMFVRVTGQRIETCPISGTIARGQEPISDAENILQLLNSSKDASELTMCTDVDRNDKSRICIPGSVKVIGRRQIEMYSRVIHTVDHVEGLLRDEFDSLDAFLTHTWVVTVTGAPKIWAMQFIEEHEKSERRWYGGAIGWLQFNGDINTGLTIRTLRIKNGVAELRAGATLLFDSEPEAEETETFLKASAFLDAVKGKAKSIKADVMTDSELKTGVGKNVLLVDHQDSFVHTLANYLRQTGATVTTLRNDFAEKYLAENNPDLVVLSPGPGCPKDFDTAKNIKLTLEKNIPIFGVCLGLQALVEYFGGNLLQLNEPMHGKASKISHSESDLFAGVKQDCTIGRYHSLYADPKTFPACLAVTAHTIEETPIIMAIKHQTLPIAAVQFHPESIYSQNGLVGLKMIANAMRMLS